MLRSKLLIVFIGFLLVNISISTARADEGMWILPLLEKLNIGTMQEKGFKLTAEDIYSLNHNSMKDAVVMFHNYCTGEVVSDQGLLLTNHHCGYDRIQSLSTLEHNFLQDGYWAMTPEDEICVPDLAVSFLKRMEDVTYQVLDGVTEDLPEEERQNKIAKKCSALEKVAQEDGKYSASVKPFFGGNQYFLVVYQVYKDIRLVGTPPSSIGKFGDETDNWMWPRHTGDFSIFRIYADSTGMPSDYTASNRPLKPAHYFPVSIKGYQEDEYAMVMGFPGSTDRYQSSWGIEERMNITNQSRITIRGAKQEIWMSEMKSDAQVKLQYASKYARSSNYWKNSIGMNLGLNKLDVLTEKRALEEQFGEWVKTDSSRSLYLGVLDSLKMAYHKRSKLSTARAYLIESLLRGAELPYFAYSATSLKKALEKKDASLIAAEVAKLKILGREFYKNYHPQTDEKVLAKLIPMYLEVVDRKYYPDFILTAQKKYGDDYGKFAQALFKKSLFASQQRFDAFLKKPSLKALSQDMAFQAGYSFMNMYGDISGKLTDYNMAVDRFSRKFQAGLMAMQPDKVFYSDANFTMRLTYGNVGGYNARDAVYYRHFTTLEGVMEKEDSTNWEFIVPSRLKDLYKSRDYGRYADRDGTMHVCFITNNDITGGNSGSPVINGNGELIGLAFDGNWEAMSGDIAFENKLQKCINTDIRYVLFVIDKFAGCSRLIDEMDIR